MSFSAGVPSGSRPLVKPFAPSQLDATEARSMRTTRGASSPASLSARAFAATATPFGPAPTTASVVKRLRLLPVVLDDPLWAHSGVVRIPSGVLESAPQVQQVPAPIEMDLDFSKPPTLLVGCVCHQTRATRARALRRRAARSMRGSARRSSDLPEYEYGQGCLRSRFGRPAFFAWLHPVVSITFPGRPSRVGAGARRRPRRLGRLRGSPG